jgi:hypothetical protein
MRKIPIIMVAIGIFLLLFAPFTAVSVLPENIEPGDTFIYSISEWDVPWEQIIGPDPGIDVSRLVLDLSGSTLGVKIMDTYDNGYYLFDIYVVLGKTIKIPLPDDADPQLYEIFGDEFTLEEGVGLGIGSLPGSDLMAVFAAMEDNPGIPFYLNPDEWVSYQAYFEGESTSEVPIEVTNEDGSDFIVSASGTDDGVDISMTIEWFRDGDYAGVFKGINAVQDGDLDGDGVDEHLEVAVSFDKKEHNPLPVFIRNKDDLTLTMETAQMEYTSGGFFAEDDIDDVLVYAEDVIEDLEGETMAIYNIQDVMGCYYNTSMTSYMIDLETFDGSLEDAGSTWFNGFTGYPVFNQSEYLIIYPSNLIDSISLMVYDLPYDSWSMSYSLVPMGAPGITPDWDMWKASTATVAELMQIAEKGIKNFADEPEVTDMGIDLNSLDMLYELRYGNGVYFFYTEMAFNLGWDAGSMSELPPGLTTDSEMSAKATMESWIAYKEDGSLAGAGMYMDVSVAVQNMPMETDYVSGDLNMKMTLETKSDKITDLPDPEEADPIAGGDGGGDGLTPGFETVPVLLFMAAIVIVVRRRR